MSKHAPHNGPSKTGNPSGSGRGNNSPDDEEDCLFDCSPDYLAALNRAAPRSISSEEWKNRRQLEEQEQLSRLLKDAVERGINRIRSTKDDGVACSYVETQEALAVDKRIDTMAMILRALRRRESAELCVRAERHMRSKLSSHESRLLSQALRREDGIVSGIVSRNLTTAEMLNYFSIPDKA